MQKFVQRQLPMQQQHLGRDRGRHIGIAVAIAPDPRTEGQPARGRPDLRIMPAQRAQHVVLQTRQGIEERGVKIPKPGPRFIRHLRSRHSAAIRQPERNNLPLHPRRVRRFALQLGRITLAQDLRHPAQLGQERAAFRFRRMRGEDQLDAQAIEKRLHLRGGNALVLQLLDRGLDRFTDRLARAATFVIGLRAAAPAQQHDPEIFLGQIHQLEIESERHRLVDRCLRAEARDGFRELAGGVGVAFAARLGQGAQFFHRLESRPAFQLRDHPPERVAQETNLRAQRREILQRGGCEAEVRSGMWQETTATNAPPARTRKRKERVEDAFLRGGGASSVAARRRKRFTGAAWSGRTLCRPMFRLPDHRRDTTVSGGRFIPSCPSCTSLTKATLRHA